MCVYVCVHGNQRLTLLTAVISKHLIFFEVESLTKSGAQSIWDGCPVSSGVCLFPLPQRWGYSQATMQPAFSGASGVLNSGRHAVWQTLHRQQCSSITLILSFAVLHKFGARVPVL